MTSIMDFFLSKKSKHSEATKSDAGEAKRSVATPLPDKTVQLKSEPSLLSPDFDRKRAMAEAKYIAFQKGMKQMEEEKK